MNREDLAKKCIQFVGGVDNISVLSHCATRLRFTLKDVNKLDKKAIEECPDIIKMMQVGTQTQLIVGSDAPSLYGTINIELEKSKNKNTDSENSHDEKEANEEKKSIVGKFFDACSSIFTPLVPAFTAAGMIKAVLAILVLFGLSKESNEYVIINMVSDTIFYYMPVLLAVTTATYLNCNRFIAAAICAMFVHPTFVGLVTAGEITTFFGIPVTLVNYSSSVFPTLLTVWFMSYVEKFAHKISPKVVRAIMEPMLTFLITFPVGLLLLGPIGSIFGQGFMIFFEMLDNNVPFLVPTIMGAISPFLVFVGMHQAISTLETMQIAQQGSSAICGTGMLPSNIAQGASTLVLSLKSKDERYKPLAFTAAVTALCGITEPALYGFTSKNKKSLIATVIGGGVGGFYAGCTHLVRFAKGAPGLPTLPVFISLENPMNIVNACICVAIAFFVTLVVAWILIKPDEIK